MSAGDASRLRVLVVVVAVYAVAAGSVLFAQRIATERREQRHIDTCIENVRALLQAEMSYRMDKNPIYYPGTAHLLHFAKRLGLPGGPGVLLCPADRDVIRRVGARERQRYADVHLDDSETFVDLASYAVRNYPQYPMHPGEPEWLICDRQGPDGRTPHHANGLVVGFEDGTARFVDREELGLERGETIVVGPNSTHPEARKMIFGRQRKD